MRYIALLCLLLATAVVDSAAEPNLASASMGEVCRSNRADAAYRFSVESKQNDVTVVVLLRLDPELRMADGSMNVVLGGKLMVGTRNGAEMRWSENALSAEELQAIVCQIGDIQIFSRSDDVVEPIPVVVDGTSVECDRFFAGVEVKRKWGGEATVIGRETMKFVVGLAGKYEGKSVAAIPSAAK